MVTQLSAEKVIPANGLLVSDQAVVLPPRTGGVHVEFRELRVVERFCLKIAIEAGHHNVY
jgi:hypothetical protein